VIFKVNPSPFWMINLISADEAIFPEHPIRNDLAPNQVFNAVPSPPFSAAAELAPLRHPRRPARLGSLEGQLGKAKPSMVASAIPNRCF